MSTETRTASAIDALLLEDRRYEPPKDFAAQANADESIYKRDFEEFWRPKVGSGLPGSSRSSGSMNGRSRTPSGI